MVIYGESSVDGLLLEPLACVMAVKRAVGYSSTSFTLNNCSLLGFKNKDDLVVYTGEMLTHLLLLSGVGLPLS